MGEKICISDLTLDALTAYTHGVSSAYGTHTQLL